MPFGEPLLLKFDKLLENQLIDPIHLDYEISRDIEFNKDRMIREAKSLLETQRIALEQEKARRSEEKKKEMQMKKMEFAKSGSCVRCGNAQRTKSEGSRNEGDRKVLGLYCADVLSCEWDAWRRECCQYCHQQFLPQAMETCSKAPVDPWGNQPHVPGGKFWSQTQVEEVRRAEEIAEKVISEQRKKKLKEAMPYFCKSCGRGVKPSHPVSCLDCNIANGFRKGKGKTDFKKFPKQQ